jgi:hypothetical protein
MYVPCLHEFASLVISLTDGTVDYEWAHRALVPRTEDPRVVQALEDLREDLDEVFKTAEERLTAGDVGVGEQDGTKEADDAAEEMCGTEKRGTSK